MVGGIVIRQHRGFLFDVIPDSKYNIIFVNPDETLPEGPGAFWKHSQKISGDIYESYKGYQETTDETIYFSSFNFQVHIISTSIEVLETTIFVGVNNVSMASPLIEPIGEYSVRLLQGESVSISVSTEEDGDFYNFWFEFQESSNLVSEIYLKRNSTIQKVKQIYVKKTGVIFPMRSIYRK